jgi:hypothetical protein
MNLEEFRQRWTKSEASPATTDLDDVSIARNDDQASPKAEPQALSPLRFKPNYVPEQADRPWADRYRGLAGRGLIVGLVFVAAAVALGLTYRYLPIYLARYVLDR